MVSNPADSAIQGKGRLTAYVRRQMQAGRLRSGDAEHMVDRYREMCLTPLYRQRLMT